MGTVLTVFPPLIAFKCNDWPNLSVHVSTLYKDKGFFTRPHSALILLLFCPWSWSWWPSDRSSAQSSSSLAAAPARSSPVPNPPFASTGASIDSYVFKLGPTRMMVCAEVAKECWTLDLGSSSWERAQDMLFAHPYDSRCHLDFGDAKMALGGNSMYQKCDFSPFLFTWE